MTAKEEVLISLPTDESSNQSDYGTYNNNNEPDNSDNNKIFVIPNERESSSKFIYLFVIAYIIFNVTASVCRKLMYDSYGHRYQFFRLQLTNLLYNLYATIVVMYRIFYSGEITTSMRKYPLYKFAGLALLDGFADFFTSVGGVNTPGDWQVLINQLVIPITMIFAFVILAQRFTNIEISGATVVVCGLIIALIPLFDGSAHSSSSTAIKWYSIIIFMVAQFPKSLSVVYKEYAFREAALDIFYLTCLVSWLQLLITWIFVPLQSLPSFGGVSLSSIPEVYRGGINCFLGDRNTPVYGNDDKTITGYCSSDVPRFTMMFSISGFFSGVTQLLVLKYGSAVLSVMATAIALPLANIAFSIPFIMGAQVEDFSLYDILGLILVLIGFILYRWNDIKTFSYKKIYDEDVK